MFAFNLPIRASTPRCFARSHLSERPHFDPDLGSRLVGRLGLECRKLSVSVDWGKIDLAAKMGAGCFKVAKKSDRGLKVEFDSGGQDFFDADAVEAAGGGAPEHLVIMVNGMVGRYECLVGF